MQITTETQMADSAALPNSPGSDRSAAVLHWLHGLLASESPSLDLPELLAQLALVFAAQRAGLGRSDVPDVDLPWHAQPQLLAPLNTSELHELRTAERHYLLAALHPGTATGWFLWIERDTPTTPGERAALTLVAQTLQRRHLRRASVEQDLEKASLVVSRLAHEYGNVLTSILGFSELGLNQTIRDAALLRYLQEVHRGAEQGAQLTNRLRMFARRVPVASVRPVNLVAALRDELPRLQANQWPERIRIELDAPAELPAVAVSQEALREILTCLLDNAREAIVGEGKIALSVKVRTVTADERFDILGHLPAGPCVEVAIHDSGKGLSPEACERLFREMFYTTKPRHRGLGLFVAYGLIATHRGGLQLTNHPQGGTVASVFFPVTSAVVPEAPSLPTATSRAQPARILVVDDDPAVLKLVSTTLRQNGYTVTASSNAHDALTTYRAAQHEPFDLVVSDVAMPLVNGVQLARDLLSHNRHQRLLFISGHANPDFMQQSFAQRPVELLAKPFRPDGLLRAVRNALDRPLVEAGR